MSETAIKDKGLLGTRGRELCENMDVHWMTPSCDDETEDNRKLIDSIIRRLKWKWDRAVVQAVVKAKYWVMAIFSHPSPLLPPAVAAKPLNYLGLVYFYSLFPILFPYSLITCGTCICFVL